MAANFTVSLMLQSMTELGVKKLDIASPSLYHTPNEENIYGIHPTPCQPETKNKPVIFGTLDYYRALKELDPIADACPWMDSGLSKIQSCIKVKHKESLNFKTPDSNLASYVPYSYPFVSEVIFKILQMWKDEDPMFIHYSHDNADFSNLIPLISLSRKIKTVVVSPSKKYLVQLYKSAMLNKRSDFVTMYHNDLHSDYISRLYQEDLLSVSNTTSININDLISNLMLKYDDYEDYDNTGKRLDQLLGQESTVVKKDPKLIPTLLYLDIGDANECQLLPNAYLMFENMKAKIPFFIIKQNIRDESEGKKLLCSYEQLREYYHMLNNNYIPFIHVYNNHWMQSTVENLVNSPNVQHVLWKYKLIVNVLNERPSKDLWTLE